MNTDVDRAYTEALRERDEALRAYIEARLAREKAEQAYTVAWRSFNEAYLACDEAYAKTVRAGRVASSHNSDFLRRVGKDSSDWIDLDSK